ncbi:MAG: GNAT family N-acetyltransferase [Pseudomonadota bacterium]
MSRLAIPEIPVLETERLILRPHREADLDDWVAFYASDRAAPVGGFKDRDQVWRGLVARLGHWMLRGYGMWAVEEKATGLLCGQVGPHCPVDWPEPEIGWLLLERAEGRGIALEAALASRRFAYETLGWETAISLITDGNTRSIALARRMGARPEGVFVHGRYGDMPIYRHPAPSELVA